MNGNCAPLTRDSWNMVQTTRPVSSSASRISAFPDGWEGHQHRHCIWVVTPKGYVHSQAFAEAAYALQCAFEELGGSAPVVYDAAEWRGRIPIIYGGNLLREEAIRTLPKGSVIVNLEQLSPESTWMTRNYGKLMHSFAVLDYSPRNRQKLIDAGFTHAEMLEVGYSSRLSRIESAPVKDIDVLFYGSLNAERKEILDRLTALGLNVVHLFGVYGAERDKAIARAKVVLNMHYFRSAIFEIVRVSYLLANQVCVVTEGDIHEPDIQPYIAGMAVTPYAGLVERCVQLVNDEAERQAIAQRGFAIMASRPQSTFLLAAMNPAGA